MSIRLPTALPALLAFLFLASAAHAEPYFALETGLDCAQCHVNPTGGGMRTDFGNVWAQTQMSARRIGPQDAPLWTGRVVGPLAIGGNVRGNADYTDIPNEGSSSEFQTEEARFYAQGEFIPQRLVVYLDERLAPGGATNLESYVRLSSAEGGYYLKGGRFYLPFGWRLEDDNAFVRQLSGINMQTPDEGVEVGLARWGWSGQLTLTNGSGGGPETDDGKQVIATVVRVRPRWRIGVSGLYNDADEGDRFAGALYGGLRLGPTVWLAEVDYVDDDSLGDSGRQQIAALAEVNWRIVQGHNLKLTHEWLDPDDDVDEDEQTRTSAVYEWSPIQFLQLRSGVRAYDGPGQIDIQNRTEAFLQLHGYF